MTFVDRNLIMALDYCTGTSTEELANREHVSQTRIYQILNKLAFRHTGVNSIKWAPKLQLMNALLRAANPGLRHIGPSMAQTPEEFWTEMNDEPRIRNFS